MRYWLYILIGAGVVMGMELMHGKDMNFAQRALVIATWPVPVTATVFAALPKIKRGETE